ncbi:MAG: hypothetical protein IPM21_09980 [Acidobacteria bacterium]|nr:hypothetical protein [Acidobacteriota bacterium]
MGNSEKATNSEQAGKTDAARAAEPSIEEQVDREFEHAEDLGESEGEQIKDELNELKYMLPSPENSLEDAAYTNINADQKGLAYGTANQRNEPLDMTEKREKRDEDRWELNPASAESEDENI